MYRSQCITARLQPCHTDADDSAGLQPLRASAAKPGNQLSTNGTAEAVPWSFYIPAR
jgi:hypothetical protein